jgi:outer membrane lipase/esterase
VAVLNLPDSTLTPFGASLPANAKPVLTGLVDVFNLWLREGLTGRPVLWFDANTTFKAAYNNPGAYGITNNTAPACDAAAISAITGGAVTDGSSLFCNSTVGAPYYGLRAGADPTTWQFADGVHPTTGGHKIFSDAVVTQLQAAGWL